MLALRLMDVMCDQMAKYLFILLPRSSFMYRLFSSSETPRERREPFVDTGDQKTSPSTGQAVVHKQKLHQAKHCAALE